MSFIEDVQELQKQGYGRDKIAKTLKCTIWAVRRALGRTHSPFEDAATSGDVEEPILRAAVVRKLRGGWRNIHNLAVYLKCSTKTVEATIDHLSESGYLVLRDGARARIVKEPQIAGQCHTDANPLLKDGWRKIGVIGDTHLASKYARLDVLEAAYDRFAEEGITDVYHTGNIVDGECRFNQYELLAHGVTDQALYCLDNYPQRSGITTHYVTGSCHEGWWMARDGIDFGRYLQFEASEQGRTDLNYLGYMEADVKLVGPNGRSSFMRILHPGGGSAYAMSYRPQKIIECVPLDSEILTRTGWKKWHQVQVGQEVLGYNQETECCEWTKLTAINQGRGEVVTYKNDNYKVRCTRNHRWVMEAEARGGPNPNSKIPEKYTRTDKVMATIDAVKNDWKRYRIVQAALAPSGPGWSPTEHHDWIDRMGTVQAVMKMTSEQRNAFIYGMMIGEGPVNDAFALACFLEGIAPGMARVVTKKINGEDKLCCRTTMLRKNRRMLLSMSVTNVIEEDVWCPTTGLGTWVMRQGDVITITGNSLQGGEKPAVLLCGHFHKQANFMIRNVWTVLTGTTQDQSSFMRKHSIEAHLGYAVVNMQQDERGAVRRRVIEETNYYDRGYHEVMELPC